MAIGNSAMQVGTLLKIKMADLIGLGQVGDGPKTYAVGDSGQQILREYADGRMFLFNTINQGEYEDSEALASNINASSNMVHPTLENNDGYVIDLTVLTMNINDYLNNYLNQNALNNPTALDPIIQDIIQKYFDQTNLSQDSVGNVIDVGALGTVLADNGYEAVINLTVHNPEQGKTPSQNLNNMQETQGPSEEL